MLNSTRGFFRGLYRWIRDCTNQLAELGLRLQICIIDDGPIDETAVAARWAGAKALFMTVWRPSTRSAENSYGIRQG